MDAGVAGGQVVVADEDHGGLVHVQDGHAIDGRAFRFTGGRVHDVAGAYHQHCVAVLEIIVDGFQLAEQVVVHVNFRQKHVHVAGHAASHRMDGIAHAAAPGFHHVGQFLDLVLGLGEGHAVAGHDDQVLHVGQSGNGSRLLHGSFLDFGSGLSRRGGGLRGFSSFFLRRHGLRNGLDHGLAQQDAGELAVHGPAHDLGQQHAAGAHDSADGHQQDVVDGHAGDGAGHTAQGVQQGDGDGHVGAAYADGEEVAEGQGGQRDDEVRRNTDGLKAAHDDAGDSRDQQGGADGGVAGKDLRAAVHLAGQLQSGNQAAHEGDAAHGHGQAGSHDGEEVALAGQKLEGTDHGAGQTADAV